MGVVEATVSNWEHGSSPKAVAQNVQAWRRAPLDLLVGRMEAQSRSPTPYLL